MYLQSIESGRIIVNDVVWGYLSIFIMKCQSAGPPLHTSHFKSLYNTLLSVYCSGLNLESCGVVMVNDVILVMLM